ncbi:MAG: hypothetical protein KDD60_04735, partial [Bdellovibrionales bacterium]|nr:hypothetical protein [Bdellovibrionales bacterium]
MSNFPLHPVFVHFPIVLPWVMFIALFFIRKESRENLQRFWYFFFCLSIFNCGAALCAFYSGQWAAELVRDELNAIQTASLEWHQVFGRVVLALSATLAGMSYIALHVDKRRGAIRMCIGILVSMLLLVCMFSGYTGGLISH